MAVDAALLDAAHDLRALAVVVADSIGQTERTVVLLCLLDGDGERLRIDAGANAGRSLDDLPHDSPRLDGDFVGPAIRTHLPQRASSTAEDVIGRAAPGLRPLLTEIGARHMLVVPLLVQDRAVGALVALRGEPGGPFDDDDEVLVQALAARVALPAEHARLLASSHHHAELEASLARIGERALAEESLDALFALVVDELRRILQVDTAGIIEALDDGETGMVRAAVGLELGTTIVLSDEARRRLRSVDGSTWTIHLDGGSATDPAAVHLGVRTALTILVRADGFPALFVGAGRHANHPFGGDDCRFLASVAHLLLASIALRTTQTRLRRQAHADALTGLPNRTLLAERLAAIAAERPSGQLALLLADLDDFKLVNDSMGHVEGDLLLRTVAARLSAIVRPSDLVARIGGDEFAILCPSADERGAVAIAERALAALAEPLTLGTRTVVPRASIGIAVHDPADEAPEAIERLFTHADLAMYRAKADGGHRVAVYDTALHERVERQLGIEQGLRAAIAADRGLSLVYQPIVSLRDGFIRGLEALVRWTDPVLGPLLPDEFVPLAEQSHLVVDLDRWVLATAARQAVAWAADGLLGEGRRVGVNLSGRHFAEPGLAGRMAEVLADAGCPARLMLFEITETLLTDGLAPPAIHDLLDLGVEVAVDDYGAGYSSLAQLKRIPVRFVKIDRSFVAGLLTDRTDATIVRSTLALGAALGKRVIAEGIETPAQLRALVAAGCKSGQGYLFGRPADAATATRWLRNGLDVPVGRLHSEPQSSV